VTRRIVKSIRGLSPVIATVILVSVTIVVAVAVSYWMGGIAGLYTRFEKIEISSCYAVKNSTNDYTVTVELKNTGSADATISYVLINGKPVTEYNNSTYTGISVQTVPQSLPLGKSETISIGIDKDLFEAGTTLDLKFHSAAGKDYPQMLALP